jgi:glycosyltransferase involved in cell wall biosynthesis
MVHIRACAPGELAASGIEAAGIETPCDGDLLHQPGVEIRGWCRSRECPVVAAELIDVSGTVVRRGIVESTHPETSSFHPGRVRSVARFTVVASIVGLSPLMCRLHVVLANGTRVGIASIWAERDWDHSQAVGAPLASVIIPCFNQSRFLGQAIESALTQTYPHVETIVVDDGSHDNAAEVAGRYRGVRYLRQSNQGVSLARNLGLLHSRGGYLVFLDADDRLRPDALTIGLEELAAHPTAAFAAGRCVSVDFAGTLRPDDIPDRVATDPYRELLRNCYIWTNAAVMFRRLALIAVGAFDPRFGASADHDLFLRVARCFPVRCHERIVAEYRRHGTNMTRAADANLRDRIAVLRNQRRMLGPEFGRYHEAYTNGLAFARDYFGRPLVTSVVSDVLTGNWRDAWAGYRTLVTHHPQGAASVLVWLARQRRTAAGRGGNGPHDER